MTPSGGLKTAPSALDEETQLRIALDISKDEEEKRRRMEEVKAQELEEAQRKALAVEEAESPQPSPEASHGVPALVPANNEVGHRIKGAPTRRHILRQNSAHWSIEPSNSLGDRQRLLDNLKLYGLMEKEVKGDGNCQFRALSDQLYSSSLYHAAVRHQVVKQLRATPQAYEGFVDDDFGSYCNSMAKSGTWGDHITLQAAADAYDSRIIIVSSFQEECVIEILPSRPGYQPRQPGARTLFLSFWHEVHYGSVYLQGSSPPPDVPPKTMGSKHLYKLFHL